MIVFCLNNENCSKNFYYIRNENEKQLFLTKASDRISKGSELIGIIKLVTVTLKNVPIYHN